MQLPLDSSMTLSVVNLYLRDRYASLEEFCKAEDVDMEDLKERLAKIDCYYDADQNRFR